MTASLQELPVFRPEHRTTPSCEHDAAHLAEVCYNGMLPVAKPLLTFYVEYQRYAGARALLDLLIGISKWQAELFSEQASDGALTSAHRTDKDVIVSH